MYTTKKLILKWKMPKFRNFILHLQGSLFYFDAIYIISYKSVSILQNCVFEFCGISRTKFIRWQKFNGLYYQIIDTNVIVLVLVGTTIMPIYIVKIVTNSFKNIIIYIINNIVF